MSPLVLVKRAARRIIRRAAREDPRKLGSFEGQEPPWLTSAASHLARLPFRSTKAMLYNRRYWSTGDPPKRPLYHRLADALLELVEPSSAVDVGCGTGIILAHLAEHGVEIRGVEGSGPAIKASPIGDRIEHRDLSQGPPDLGHFDVCLCIEVAEHLPPRSGPPLVEGLTRLSDLVVFTAAPPGQRGKGHINERPQSYWTELFAQQGFRESPLRERLAQAIASVPEPWWIHRNLMVLERTAAAT